MNNFQSLKCKLCFDQLAEFVVLACNHAICADCLSSHTQTDSSIVVIACTCGITTNLPRQKDFGSISLLKPCSSAPNIKNNRTQILDKTLFTIFDHTPSRIKTPKLSKLTRYDHQHLNLQKYSNSQHYLQQELENEIKFMQLHFKRYLNEINRGYNKLICQLNKNYQRITKTIFSKCKSKIEIGEIKSLSSISKQIEIVFKTQLESKLIKLSNTFTDVFQSFQVKDLDKQNTFSINKKFNQLQSKAKKRNNKHADSKGFISTCSRATRINKSNVKMSKIKRKTCTWIKSPINQYVFRC